MKFKGLNIEQLEIKEERLLLTCSGPVIDVGQQLGIVYETINCSKETLDQIRTFNLSDRVYRIAELNEYPGKWRQRGTKIIKRQSTTVALTINQVVIEDKKEVEKHAFTFAFSLFN